MKIKDKLWNKRSVYEKIGIMYSELKSVFNFIVYIFVFEVKN